MTPDKIEAAIARLEAEKQRRIDEKVEKGEAIRVPLHVVVGEPDEANAAAIEDARARKLAELRGAGERREIVFDEPLVIITGVPRSPGYGKWQASADPLPELPKPTPEPR